MTDADMEQHLKNTCTTWDPTHLIQIVFKHGLDQSPAIVRTKCDISRFLVWAKANGIWGLLCEAVAKEKPPGPDPPKNVESGEDDEIRGP